MRKAVAVALFLFAFAAFGSDLPIFMKLKPKPDVTVYQFNMPQTPAPQRHQYDDGSGPAYFICPKDRAELKVPAAAPHATYKCPVDGTEMQRGKGPEKRIYLLE